MEVKLGQLEWGNELTLDRNEIKMIRLICGVRLLDRKTNVELRESLRVENI